MNAKELKIEFYKSGGPGGQHKNKRFMAVRITHLPTGLVAVAQENRSQSQNREKALERLKKKLEEKFKRRKSRIPTKTSRAAKERILAWKKHRSRQKQHRRERFIEDKG